MYKNFIKPFFDFLIALFLLIILSPIIIITAILLFFTNHGLVLFMQQRPGLNCKPFNIIKFKTMRDSFFKNGQPLPDDERLTKIGKLIRSTSIDELLQLINVIKGEMSLIGPRPLMMQYISRYNSHQIKRQNVKPGITGWAQVNGRNSIKWDEKFFFDVEYVEKISFMLDIKILYLTFFNVIKRDGINTTNNTIMEEFMGNGN